MKTPQSSGTNAKHAIKRHIRETVELQAALRQAYQNMATRTGEARDSKTQNEI